MKSKSLTMVNNAMQYIHNLQESIIAFNKLCSHCYTGDKETIIKNIDTINGLLNNNKSESKKMEESFKKLAQKAIDDEIILLKKLGVEVSENYAIQYPNKDLDEWGCVKELMD